MVALVGVERSSLGSSLDRPRLRNVALVATIREKRPGVWEVRVFTGTRRRGTADPDVANGPRRQARRAACRRRAGGRTGPGQRRRPHGQRRPRRVGRAEPRHVGAVVGATISQSRVRSIKQDPIAAMPLARLSVADVERWHTRLRKAGMARRRHQNQHGVLRAALAQARAVGLGDRRTSRRSPGCARRRSSSAPSMTVDDVRAVIDAAATIDPAAALALRLAAVAGARRAELAALRWTDVRGGQLHDRLGDRGRPPAATASPTLRDAATKTANARTRHARRRHARADRSAPGRARAVRAVDVRPRSRAGQPDRIGWWWRRAREPSPGIDAKWRLHDLRHWSATVAIGQGHDVRTVAGRLGHANPAMTLRVYAHAFAAADQAVAAGLGEMLKRASGEARFRPPTRSSTSRSAASATSWPAC